MKLKRNLLLLILSITVFACNKPSPQMVIQIRNSTTDSLNVNLFPRQDLSKNEICYKSSEIDGGYSPKNFTLYPNESNYIYISKNISIKPGELMKEVFDSVFIESVIKSNHQIKFYHDSIAGYSENMFSSESNWAYEFNEIYLESFFHRPPVESDEYTFQIKSE